MNIEVIKKEAAKTSQWAGGTSTQLFIYPEGAELKKQDFTFRLSTATVAVEEAEFTVLPNVARTLMVLDGKLLLVHEGRHSKTLKAFEQHCFKGEWITKSYGKATDFNLMTTGNTSGKISVVDFLQSTQHHLMPAGKMEFLYIYKGTVKLDAFTFGEGDSAFLTGTQERYTLFGDEQAKIIRVIIL